jgi:hypothetical protein
MSSRNYIEIAEVIFVVFFFGQRVVVAIGHLWMKEWGILNQWVSVYSVSTTMEHWMLAWLIFMVLLAICRRHKIWVLQFTLSRIIVIYVVKFSTQSLV